MAGIAGYYLEFLDEPGCVFGGLELVSLNVDFHRRIFAANLTAGQNLSVSESRDERALGCDRCQPLDWTLKQEVESLSSRWKRV